MKHIYLVRHGQSEGNVKSNNTGVIHGRNDQSRLTLHGREQVKTIAQLIHSSHESRKFGLWYSPIQRTSESANIIEQFVKTNFSRRSEDLFDIDFGSFEGRTWQEVVQTNQEWQDKYQRNRFETKFPQGESVQELHIRIATFISKNILDSDVDYHIVVTHEETIRGFLSYKRSEPMHYHSRTLFKIPNASLSVSLVDQDDSVVLQVGSDGVPPVFNLDKLRFAHKWFIQRTSIQPDFFLPRKSHSENSVYTVSYQKTRETVKIIPQSNLKGLTTDLKINRYMTSLKYPVPQFIEEDTIDEIHLLRRSFVPGKIAEYWITHHDQSQLILILLGQLMRQLHLDVSINATGVEIPNNHHSWHDFIVDWMEQDCNILAGIHPDLAHKLTSFFHANESIIKKRTELTFVHNDLSILNLSFDKIGNRMLITGVWDFERAFKGDPLWDLAVTRKTSFLRSEIQLKDLCQGYFGRGPTEEDLQIIYVYTVMNTSGAIRYSKKVERSFEHELKNLDYILEKVTRY